MTLSEEERKFRLKVCAHALLVNVAKNSTSSELNLLQNLGKCPDHNKCKNENCTCLPHICFRPHEKLRLAIQSYIEKKLQQCEGADKVYFETDFKRKRNNPVVICMNRLNYSLDYIKEYVKGCTFQMVVLKNLDFYGLMIKISKERPKLSWYTLDCKALNNQKKFAELSGKNLTALDIDFAECTTQTFYH